MRTAGGRLKGVERKRGKRSESGWAKKKRTKERMAKKRTGKKKKKKKTKKKRAPERSGNGGFANALCLPKGKKDRSIGVGKKVWEKK